MNLRSPLARRRVAVAIPAHNEAAYIGACLERLMDLETDPRVIAFDVVVLANNCADATADRAEAAPVRPGRRIHVERVVIPPDRAHAGWARRLALDAAAAWLRAPEDVLMCTDADTLVDRLWLSRSLDHLDAGWDAVAGRARLNPRELKSLAPRHRLRLAAIQKYENALTFLKARQKPDEAWPRHYYEGGASIALLHGVYQRIGGAPTPPVAEDKALFEAVRRHGGRVRHATDVRVTTSSRLDGRAPGGASDTLSIWGRQGENEPIHEMETLAASLGLADGRAAPGGGGLTFAELADETKRARSLVSAARRSRAMALAG